MMYFDLITLIVVTLGGLYYYKRAVAYFKWGRTREAMFYIAPLALAIVSWFIFTLHVIQEVT